MLAEHAAVFLVDVDASGTPDPPLPGGLHRYRVRAVDPVGRPSPAWTETDPVRLEKHVPPPVPVGPDEVGTAAPEALTVMESIRGTGEEVVEGLSGVAFLLAVLLGVVPRAVLPAGWPLRRAADDEVLAPATSRVPGRPA